MAAAPALGRRVVWGTVAALLAAFALTPVLLSHDAFSYVDYARLGVVHGLDPYVHRPDAVPTDPAFADVTWTHTASAYGPLFTLVTYPLAWLPVDAAVAVLKASAALAVGALALIVARIAAWRGVDPLRAAAFLALNPLVLVHVVGGAHNDALAMLLATIAVAAVLARRDAGGGVVLVAAVAIKASAAFLAPFALLGALERRRAAIRFAMGAAAAVLAIGAAAYLAFGWDWTRGLGHAGENQGRTSHLSVPATVARIAGVGPGPVRVTALVLYALAVVGLLAWTWRGGDWVRAAGWAGLGLLLATSWLLPWYLIWALPLAAVSRDRPLQALTLALTAFQLGARIPL
ncbi:MAG: polyprenol phosphomannose-dependent alpha 1,6 mannosyltransferase MptB [Syntrophothermus sp.]